jgi:hypothetical protein
MSDPRPEAATSGLLHFREPELVERSIEKPNPYLI